MNEHPRLRAIGKHLQDEESRFVGYEEIERKSKELGFGMSVRTLRFYVDEAILPAPKKVGKRPMYEEEWILNTLLSIHLMKTRFNRSLTEIRAILGNLQDSPETLADKLSVLYEDYAKGGFLKPTERAGLIDTFFDLLTGRLGESFQPGAIRLADLVDTIAAQGRWEGDEWIPPDGTAILASQGSKPKPAKSKPKASSKRARRRKSETALKIAQPEESEADVEELTLEESSSERVSPIGPADAITAREARALEQSFVTRFKVKFERLGRVHCPLDGKGYKAGPREHTFIKRDRSSDVIELMKSRRIYDRSLLDALPLNESREFQVCQRGLFGRGDLKVVVTALTLSPLDALVQQRWAKERLGAPEAKRAVGELDLPDDVFHYVGILSTVGWTPDAVDQIPARRNLLCCLVENVGGSAWRLHMVPDDRWGGVETVFDPETEEEKVDRVRSFMEHHLRPKGEFLILRNLCEDLDVPPTLVQTAVDAMLADDGELTVVSLSGRDIIKRSRM